MNVYRGYVFVGCCYSDGVFSFLGFVHFLGCFRIYGLCWGVGLLGCFCGCVFLSGFFYILCFCFVVCVGCVCFFVLLVVYFDSCCGWCCFGVVFVCLFCGLLLFLFFCCVLMCMWCVFFWVFVVFLGFLIYIYSFCGGIKNTTKSTTKKHNILQLLNINIFN